LTGKGSDPEREERVYEIDDENRSRGLLADKTPRRKIFS
jgi:hypothetical protein